MAERNNSYFLNGGEEMGMTDNQYKGMLLDQLEVWERILSMAKVAGNIDIQGEVEKQIAKINEKLKFSSQSDKGRAHGNVGSFFLFERRKTHGYFGGKTPTR